MFYFQNFCYTKNTESDSDFKSFLFGACIEEPIGEQIVNNGEIYISSLSR